MGEVIEVGATVTIGLGEYTDVVVTQDWTPLEPDVIENKSYAPGVGVIYETDVAGGDETVELVEFTPGQLTRLSAGQAGFSCRVRTMEPKVRSHFGGIR